MFEVGKQYQHSVSKRTIEVLFVSERNAFAKTLSSGSGIVIASSETVGEWDGQWEPYTPPLVDTEECFVKWNTVGGFYISDDPSCFYDTAGTVPRGKIRFTYTEGGKLTVDVLE